MPRKPKHQHSKSLQELPPDEYVVIYRTNPPVTPEDIIDVETFVGKKSQGSLLKALPSVVQNALREGILRDGPEFITTALIKGIELARLFPKEFAEYKAVRPELRNFVLSESPKKPN